MYRFSRWLAAAGALLLIASCAQSVGDVNRVQPDVTKKADLLDGVWYFRNTVTYTPATTGFTYTGETGTLEKIVWDVNKDMAIGYRAKHPQGSNGWALINDANGNAKPYEYAQAMDPADPKVKDSKPEGNGAPIPQMIAQW